MNNSKLNYKALTKKFYNKKELSIEERKIIGVGNIKINQAKCLLCNEIVISNHRHDFKFCYCNNLFVDGGSWYLKRGFNKGENSYQELSIYYNEIKE